MGVGMKKRQTREIKFDWIKWAVSVLIRAMKWQGEVHRSSNHGLPQHPHPLLAEENWGDVPNSSSWNLLELSLLAHSQLGSSLPLCCTCSVTCHHLHVSGPSLVTWSQFLSIPLTSSCGLELLSRTETTLMKATSVTPQKGQKQVNIFDVKMLSVWQGPR